MLPSMPILFMRDSQDAFGNKIEPSTSFFSQNPTPILPNTPKVDSEPIQEDPRLDESKNKKETEIKKKNESPNVDEDALENALVKSYYQRIQTKFSSNVSGSTNKYVQFKNLLKNFDPNAETPAELYKKIEELFGDEHKDIVEDFLLFLKPGQALQVGRFMDRLMLSQMTSFINMLHRTFERKPTVLRKVLRALTTGLNSGNSEEMKARVLPHFRAHPRLTQTFKSLFPDERPCDSLYDHGYETINENFLTNDKGYDVWKFEEQSDNKRKIEAKDGLDTVYLNGRVFLQHGRLLRPARVTYPYSKEPYRVHAKRLIPHCHISPPDSDDDTNTKKPNKRTRKQTKSPTKNKDKDVNDNTKNSALLSPKPKKAQKTKNGKKEPEKDVKRERKDSKGQMQKREASTEPAKTKQAKVEDLKKDVKSNDWTRDEDKTMLEVLKGEAGSEKVFARIRELLPHRSGGEIKDRFRHVMTLLQQMAVGEVT